MSNERKNDNTKTSFNDIGFQNMTCQRYVIDIINKLDHSISHYKTCETGTAQTETANRHHQSGILLPLQPETPDKIGLTYFWVKNFDKKVVG